MLIRLDFILPNKDALLSKTPSLLFLYDIPKIHKEGHPIIIIVMSVNGLLYVLENIFTEYLY